MSARNCDELGISLQKIVSRVLENDDLINLLYYEDIDPLGQEKLTSEKKQKEIFNKLVRFVPVTSTPENSKSFIAIYISKGLRDAENSEFKSVYISIDVFTPYTEWVIKGPNLRPFAILGQLQKSLDKKNINGLGTLSGGDFELVFLTNESSCYRQIYKLQEYA